MNQINSICSTVLVFFLHISFSGLSQDVDFSNDLVPEMGEKFEIVGYYKISEITEGAIDSTGSPVQSVLVPVDFEGKTEVKIQHVSGHLYKTNFRGMFVMFRNSGSLQNPAEGVLYGDGENGIFWEKLGTLKKSRCINGNPRGL